MDGKRRSGIPVRQNLRRTVGYTLIGNFLGGVLGLVLGGLSLLASPQTAQVIDLPEFSMPALAAAILVAFVLATVVGSFLAIFSVAFYRGRSSDIQKTAGKRQRRD